jgi:plastocyanin
VIVRRWLLALAGAIGLLLPLGMPMRAATTHQIEIVDFAFSPATLTITAGDTVIWTNSDAVAHSATGSGFDSGLLGQGDSYSVTFSAAGTYDYLCTPHPTMTGRIVVQPAAAPGIPNVAMDARATAPPGWLAITALALLGFIASWLAHGSRGVRGTHPQTAALSGSRRAGAGRLLATQVPANKARK